MHYKTCLPVQWYSFYWSCVQSVFDFQSRHHLEMSHRLSLYHMWLNGSSWMRPMALRPELFVCGVSMGQYSVQRELQQRLGGGQGHASMQQMMCIMSSLLTISNSLKVTSWFSLLLFVVEPTRSQLECCHFPSWSEHDSLGIPLPLKNFVRGNWKMQSRYADRRLYNFDHQKIEIFSNNDLKSDKLINLVEHWIVSYSCDSILHLCMLLHFES